MENEEIKEIIEKCRVSRDKFAAIIGAHRNTVFEWTKGTKPPSDIAKSLLLLLKDEPELLATLARKKGFDVEIKIK